MESRALPRNCVSEKPGEERFFEFVRRTGNTRIIVANGGSGKKNITSNNFWTSRISITALSQHSTENDPISSQTFMIPKNQGSFGK